MAAASLRAAEREARLFARMWRGSVFSTLLSPILMLLALGIGIGELVDDDTAQLGGLDYITFLAPGVMVASAIQTTAGFSMWPVMAGHRWLGFHRAMVATPLTPTAVLGGHLISLAVRAAVMSAIFIAVATALDAVTSPWAVVAIPVAALTALAVAAPGSAHAARAEMDHSFDPIMRVGVTPLVLFSGTYFPVEQLPVVLEAIVKVFPLWHGVEIARGATTGTLRSVDAAHAAVLAVWLGVGWVWARHEFTKRLTA